MFGKALLVCPLSIFFLDFGTITQDDFRDIERGGRTPNRTTVTHIDQARQKPGVVHMSMGKQHQINISHIHRKILPVEFAQLFNALKHAAINEYGFVQ